MGVCLVLTTISSANADRVRGDPPIVWLVLGSTEDYVAAKRRPRSLLGRLLGRAAEQDTEIPKLDLAPGETQSCDLDKSWHAIHFLLVHERGNTNSPLASSMSVVGARGCAT